MTSARSPLSLALWLAVCAWVSLAGWALSALDSLNRTGYAVAVALLIPLCGWLGRGWRWKWTPRRFRRALPAAWAALAALVWLGGFLHAPNNYDALAYRVPRVLHWLAEGHWHWIHTHFARLNPRATGYEWLMAPFLALGGTDRWTWLPNATGYLLMPGLVFSVFTRLGIGARAAWRWMWVLPGGYGFALQAGGICNDFIGAIFALAAMHFALRARDRGAWRDLAGALIAAGLMTGVKASNLTLLLPVALALVPCWRLAFAPPVLGACAIAAAVSFLPMAVLNARHCGDWKGARYEQASALTVTPLVGLAGNAVALAAQNLNPPLLPGASKWSELVPLVFPEPLRTKALAQFEPDAFVLIEMQDERAGLGFGASLLVLWAASCGLRGGALRWAPWLSLLAYMATCGIGGVGRILIPYYALLIPALVAGVKAQRLVTRRVWLWAALGSLALAAMLVVLSPARPLWPAQTLCASLAARHPGSALVERMHTVYSVFAARADALAPLRAALPEDERVFGLITADDPETSLWRPFGARRFHHVNAEDTAADLRALGVRTVVVSSDGFEAWMRRPFDQWLREMDAERITTITLQTRAGRAPWAWHIVRLRDGAEATVGKRAPMP